MARKKKISSNVCFPTQDVVYTTERLIAASGLLNAIHHEFTTSGHLPVGAVLHVTTMIDDVIEKLRLAELELDQARLPF